MPSEQNGSKIKQALSVLKKLEQNPEMGTYTGYGYVQDDPHDRTKLNLGYTPHASELYYYRGMEPRKIAYQCTIIKDVQHPDKLFLHNGSELPLDLLIKFGELEEAFLANDNYTDAEKLSVQRFTKDAIYILVSSTHQRGQTLWGSAEEARKG